MALDTKEKRANVIGVGRPWMRDKFPVATPDEQWRIASGNAYGGNALSAPAALSLRRFSLSGSSQQRISLVGASQQRFTLTGASQQRIDLDGAHHD